MINMNNPELDLIKFLTNTSNYFKDVELKLDLYIKKEGKSKRIIQKQIIKELWEKHGKKELIFDVENTLDEFEKILSALNVRDHFTHQFKIFLLGSYIIINLRKNLYISKNTNNFYSINDILFSWLVCSTFHDMGYPIEVSAKLNGFLGKNQAY